MAKRIEMNIKENEGYEILYPQTIDKNVLINEQISGLLGIESNSSVYDALINLIVPQGKRLYTVTVTLKGEPVSDIKVSGLQEMQGTSTDLITDENGIVSGLGEFNNQQVSIDFSNYLDMQSEASVNIKPDNSNITYNYSWSLDEFYKEPDFNTLYQSSTSFYLMDTTIDLYVVGGGGSGGYSDSVAHNNQYICMGMGGGSGNYNIYSKIPVKKSQVNIVIGSGGANVSTNSYGNNGGTTTVTINNTQYQATGGGGGVGVKTYSSGTYGISQGAYIPPTYYANFETQYKRWDLVQGSNNKKNNTDNYAFYGSNQI